MEYQFRNISSYMIGGILISAVIIAGLFVSGIQFPSFINRVQTGTLTVLLTDAPVDLDNLYVTITSLSVFGESSKIDLPLLNNQTELSFDLLALRNVTETISSAQLPVGNYSKMRMLVTNATAVYPDGSSVDLKVPPGHIDIIIHFEVLGEAKTVVLIDMQPDWVAISNSNNLRPVFKASIVS